MADFRLPFGGFLSSSSMPRPGSSGWDSVSSLRVQLDGRLGIEQITWRASLLDQVRSYTTEAYSHPGSSGEEVGGILLGNRLGDALQVLAWRPIVRTAGNSPTFALDGSEESMLRRLFASTRSDSTLRGMEVLGWFRSRIRGEAKISDADMDLHRRLFVKDWHFCLLVKPSNQRPAQAQVFLRDAEGVPSLAASFLLNPGPVEVNPKQSQRYSLPEVEIDKGLDDFESPAPASRSFAPWARIAAGVVLALALLAGTVYGLRWQSQAASRDTSQSANPQAFQLKVRPENGVIVVFWDASSDLLRQAADVKLEINGATIPLSQAQIVAGSTRIPSTELQLKDIPVRLVATSKRGNVTEEFTRLIDSSR